MSGGGHVEEFGERRVLDFDLVEGTRGIGSDFCRADSWDVLSCF